MSTSVVVSSTPVAAPSMCVPVTSTPVAVTGTVQSLSFTPQGNLPQVYVVIII